MKLSVSFTAMVSAALLLAPSAAAAPVGTETEQSLAERYENIPGYLDLDELYADLVDVYGEPDAYGKLDRLDSAYSEYYRTGELPELLDGSPQAEEHTEAISASFDDGGSVGTASTCTVSWRSRVSYENTTVNPREESSRSYVQDSTCSDAVSYRVDADIWDYGAAPFGETHHRPASDSATSPNTADAFAIQRIDPWSLGGPFNVVPSNPVVGSRLEAETRIRIDGFDGGPFRGCRNWRAVTPFDWQGPSPDC